MIELCACLICTNTLIPEKPLSINNIIPAGEEAPFLKQPIMLWNLVLLLSIERVDHYVNSL